MAKTPSIEIRLLTAGDIDAWWTLRLEALEQEPRAFSSSVEEHRALSMDEVEKRLASDPENQFVVGAFVGGVLSGTTGFYRDKGPKSQHKGHVWGVYVKRELRRQGAAKMMMLLLLDCARKIEGLEQIHLAVAVTQCEATALYRSFGFEPYGREPRAIKVGNEYIDEDFLVLRLKR